MLLTDAMYNTALRALIPSSMFPTIRAGSERLFKQARHLVRMNAKHNCLNILFNQWCCFSTIHPYCSYINIVDIGSE